jgi:hypothetical protein
MTRSLTTWLLGGALAASLSWNWKQLERGAVRDEAALEACGAGSSTAGLGLAPGQSAAFEDLCRRSCTEADALERQADELEHDLLAGLAQVEIDEPGARKLVNEIGDLRRRSLASCVDGILELRKLFTPEQVGALLDRCQRGPASCK